VEKIFEKNFLTTKKNQNNVIELCKNSKKNIVIMPAGQQAIYLVQYLKEHSINVEFFVDNNEKKHGTLIGGVPVISFTEYKKISDKKFLVVATNEDVEKLLVNQLKDNNIENYKCIIADYLGYSADEIDNARELFINNFAEYFKLYGLLEDDLSRKTLVNRLNYLITYDKSYIKEIISPSKNQYFEPEIYNISSKDYFVDCGAFDGDTLDQLMSNLDNKLAGYYGFEPDDANYIKLSKKAASFDNITIIKKGVYKNDAVLKFNGTNTSSSQISDDGNIKIEVTALDNALKDKKVSFIKMDIEGAEYDALSGAKNIIVNQKPTLAISVYHKFDDIYKLPFLIESFGVKYKYYLRHYAMCSAETVLYAIPQ